MKWTTLVVSLALGCLTGCASIVSGHNQSLSVVAKSAGNDVDGASCTLWNDKGQWFAKTPGSVTVRRSYGALSVDCKTDVENGFSQVSSRTKGMAFGNIIFGGVIGVGVDVATGAAYDYPAVITIAMSNGKAILPADLSSPSTLAPAPVAIQPNTQAVLATADASPKIADAAMAPAAMPAVTPAPVSTRVMAPIDEKPKKRLQGRDEFQARRLALELQCHRSPDPILVSKDAPTETYTVNCSNGQAMAMTCEYGACRVVK